MNLLKKSALFISILSLVKVSAFDLEVWNKSKKPVYFSISSDLSNKSSWKSIQPDKSIYVDDAALDSYTRNKSNFVLGLTTNEPKKNSKYTFYTFKKPFKDIYLEIGTDGKVAVQKKKSWYSSETEHGRSLKDALTEKDFKNLSVVVPEDRIFTN